ncbi:hypothetical protein MGU_02346 [Metarhizium guizhouense ARSEF 977]|uniref:Uncharacterized protein n=1 Tax=Metarhizium guizhouense (strain ARSEF 977) TaxID=1276136 RepID=A0A0B4I9Q1_METGA|nr:hypothetical protein MGU_02346 [Metarhizium guizhouense ARSEF 977]
MKHAVLVNLFLAGSALAMPAAVPDEELGCPADEPSKDGNSLFSQQALEFQKKCQKDLFGDNSIKDIDQAGKDAICVEFGREGVKCRDDNVCLDKVGDVGDKCLKSTQKSANQPGGKFADVFLDCFRKGTSGEQAPNTADPGQPAFAEAVKLFNSCQQGSGNGCEAELLKSANHYMDVQNKGEGPECRDHVRKSAQECTKFVQNKKTIDGSAETAFRDCVNNRYDTSMRDKECSAKN